MYLRRCGLKRTESDQSYWQLVESYRTARGPRQRVLAYLGLMDEAGRLGMHQAAGGEPAATCPSLFDGELGSPQPVEPEWVEIDAKRVRLERCREFGGPWLARQVMQRIGLGEFLQGVIPPDRASVSWSLIAQILVIARLCEPSSELYVAEHFFPRSSLEDLLGVTCEQVNDDRLYRALDKLLPHKPALEAHLKARLGELFELDYELLLYDVTSTYFEGMGAGNAQAKRGYSRDNRPDCNQVCIALVVTKSGLPLAYEVFDGNRADVTTVEAIVQAVETRFGKADRIWVMDRGMVSEANVEFLRKDGRRYILGTPRSRLKAFERELVEGQWEVVHEGLEVKLCQGADGVETFILCRSEARALKEKAMHDRGVARMEDRLRRLQQSSQQRKYKPAVMERRLGRLQGQNPGGERLFNMRVEPRPDGGSDIVWSRIPERDEWATLRQGCYLLRSNITNWTATELWQAYMQLTQAEDAFRIQKQDLRLRPIWHQTQPRVQAHIMVCFLAFVVWQALAQFCKAAGLGDEPRKVFDEISQLRMIDVVLTTKTGREIRKRCITQPSKAQAILLQRLRLSLPSQMEIHKM